MSKENTSPSTESGEELLDFQPLLAMKAACCKGWPDDPEAPNPYSFIRNVTSEEHHDDG
jgi:hypothetical protein